MANEEHVKILKQGVIAWNKWREENPKITPNLRGVDFGAPNLRDADLRELHVREIYFNNIDLNKAYLNKADLSGADLFDTVLRGVKERGADLREANLRGADLRGADLSGADFSDADLSDADFRKADLNSATLSFATLRGADLRKANLTDAYLGQANLCEANLSYARLCKAYFKGAYLGGANLNWAYIIHTNFVEANLNGASLSNANLRNVDFHNANLSGVNFSMLELLGVNLSGADLTDAVFTPEGNPIGDMSFLDLSTCEGIENAKFSKPDFLVNYLTRAFEYAHDPDIVEAKRWPEFVTKAIDKIKALRSLYPDQDPPKQVVEVIGVISDEIIKYLKKHPNAMRQIEPRQFEELVAEILASYGWQVQLTPATKDGGYDIFAISKDLAGVETSWIIECKKYAAHNKVGVDIARALYGVKSLMQSQVEKVMLATTSYFTKGVKNIKASRYDLELKDYEGILEWINEYRPNPDGKLYIKDNRLILPGEE